MSNESDPPHILSNFQESLDKVRKDVLTMASTAELNLEHAVRGLLDRESSLCKTAIADDEEVDQLEKQIDQEGMRILALYNPDAGDLRAVVAAMKMTTNIERISDEAGNIARRARLVLKNKELSELNLVEPVYQLAANLFRESVRAFAEHDLELARSIDLKDDELDTAHAELIKHFRRRMEEDPSRLRDYLDLMFIVRSLERVGDHATNIAEDTIYIESAEDVRHT